MGWYLTQDFVVQVLIPVLGIIVALSCTYISIQLVRIGLKHRGKVEPIVSEPLEISPTFDLSAIYAPASFHGREKELDAIEALLQEHRVLTLLGMGGIGKSVLACKAAERVKDRFDAVWGFSFKTDTTLQNFLNEIGKRLLGKGAIEGLSGEELETDVLNGLADARRLLILDNFETVLHAQEHGDTDVDALLGFLNRISPNATLLITSREAPTHLTGEKTIQVPSLDREPAVAVIRDELSIKQEDYKADVLSEIAGKLSDHPLACRLIGGFLAESSLKPDQAVKQARNLITKAHAANVDPSLSSFDGSLSLSLDALSADERRLIEAVSIFEGPFTAEAAGFIAELDEPIPVLDRLCRRSLVECGKVPHYPKVEVYT
ncbi:MAG: NB-ARC domain-containing protein, partial [Candidatus Alcyoniella australis]|nr:NB-ARC domain-containing protein [Candidatus Alcyoniella australis]